MSQASIRAAFLAAVKSLQAVGTPTTASYWQATLSVAQAISASGLLARAGDHRLDATDPIVQQSLQRREYKVADYLLRMMWDGQRVARQLAVSAGRNPDDEARASVGLTAREIQAVDRYRRELEQNDLAAAMQRGLRDRRLDRTKTLSAARIDAAVERYRQRYTAHRATRIARTEMARARSQGLQLAWQQAVRLGKVEAGSVRRFWAYVDDDRVRHSHRMIPSMNPRGVGLDETFRSPLGPIMYPGDPEAEPANMINCRCRLEIRAA